MSTNYADELSTLLYTISGKLNRYMEGNRHLANRDIGILVRANHIASFAADIIHDEYRDGTALPEVYYLAMQKEFPTLVDADCENISLMEVYHFYHKCWAIVNDRYAGTKYKSPSAKKSGVFSGLFSAVDGEEQYS